MEIVLGTLGAISNDKFLQTDVINVRYGGTLKGYTKYPAFAGYIGTNAHTMTVWIGEICPSGFYCIITCEMLRIY